MAGPKFNKAYKKRYYELVKDIEVFLKMDNVDIAEELGILQETVIIVKSFVPTGQDLIDSDASIGGQVERHLEYVLGIDYNE